MMIEFYFRNYPFKMPTWTNSRKKKHFNILLNTVKHSTGKYPCFNFQYLLYKLIVTRADSLRSFFANIKKHKNERYKYNIIGGLIQLIILKGDKYGGDMCIFVQLCYD